MDWFFQAEPSSDLIHEKKNNHKVALINGKEASRKLPGQGQNSLTLQIPSS